MSEGDTGKGPPEHSPPSDPESPRPLTIDDVPRLGSGAGIAYGCAGIVVVTILVFWFIRGWLMHSY